MKNQILGSNPYHIHFLVPSSIFLPLQISFFLCQNVGQFEIKFIDTKIIDNSHNQFIMLEMSMTGIAVALIAIIVVGLIYQKVIKPYRQFCFYRKLLSKSYKTLAHPFSPFGIGTFGAMKRDQLKHGDSQYTLKRQYPSYQISLASFKGITHIDFIDPDLIKKFYDKQAEGYYVKSLKSPFTQILKYMIGNGLVFSEGEEWKTKRKIMSNVFNYDFLKSKIPLIAKICDQKLKESQENQVNKGQTEVKIDVSNLFQKIFGNVVVKSFFGDIEMDKIEGFQFFSYVNRMFEMNTKRALTVFAFALGDYFLKFNFRKIDREANDQKQKFQKFAEDAVLRQIHKIKNQEKSGSQAKFRGVIQLLIKENKLKASISQEDKKSDKDYYTIQDLIDEFTTFFSAGIDTTTNSTSMMIYLLAQHPTVQAKVRKEIEEFFPSPLKIENFTYENLKKLTYFDDVMKETLRMYSPTAGIVPREATKDHYIDQIPIKKGTLVGLKIKPNHFKEEFYSNPLEFNPDRWSKRDPTKTEPFSYFPFSSGKRNCIGQHLALLESKIAVVSILKRYGQITLEKPNFKMYMRTLYGAEQMTTTFQKHQP